MGTNFSYDKVANPEIKLIFQAIDAAITAVQAGAVADGSITNAKLAADVKAGSLAALTTTLKTSLQAAINEVDANADAAAAAAVDAAAAAAAAALVAAAAYVKPALGIPSTDLTQAAQDLLTLAGTALQPIGGETIIGKQITLGGANPTAVTFQGANTAATLLGTVDGPYAITAGQTFVVNPDGAGDVTATFAAAAGTSTSGATPVTDLSASVDTKFKIAIDGGSAQLVTCDWTADGGCTDGTKIATQMQTQIQAKGGALAAVTVDYNVTTAGKYTIKSGTLGTASSVIITPATNNNVTEELKIGVTDGGTEAAGTGDAADIAATTADEVATKLAALNGLTAAVVGSAVRITSDTTGAASSLAVNAGCALDTVFGITGTDRGSVGLGLAADMADTNYRIAGTFVNDGAGVTDTFSISNKATTGFNLYAETAGSVNALDLIIFGTQAA